jgi:hypothetical protein
MMVEMLEEWKNRSVIPIHMKGDTQKVVNCREINMFSAWYKLFSAVLNEN